MLNANTNVKAPSYDLNEGTVHQFCHDLLEVDGELRSLADTRDDTTLTCLALEMWSAFSDTLGKIESCLQDNDCGIAAIDVPSIYDDLTDDAIAGALVSIALTSSLMQPAKDIENQTPFTMFSASYKSDEALNQAGLLDISPTDILGFHSDGLVREKELSVPRYISIYNTFINYRNCGNFYWIPTNSVSNLSRHVESIGFDDDFIFSLTPTIYGTAGAKIENVVERKVQTSIFKETDDGRITTFINGTFAGKRCGSPDYTGRFKAFQSELSENPFRYAAAQKSRRMIVLNNANGFHARDIFEDPIEGHEETRNYLRSVSKNAVKTGHVM
ncbi:hypothetical protein [uncultured Roseibium sp.]|uniref:hypothetical protein n=1 Tax=uncultured Roseibium sp. TaxID=1936171 RepID=UPI00263626D8|nr:hypothetical protein [uncultured Roseibium sp.]